MFFIIFPGLCVGTDSAIYLRQTLDCHSMHPYDRTPRKVWLLPGLRGGESGIGAWRSLVAHLLWEQRVGSSNLSAPTSRFPSLAERPLLKRP